jgi:hypothetical protein
MPVVHKVVHKEAIQKASKFPTKSIKRVEPLIKECRICFTAASSPSAQGELRMLTNPCACKGSLSYVHEACLIQWLL